MYARFSLHGSSQEQDFPQINLITADHVEKTGFLSENVHLC
jgi:hypothetical protein